MLQWSTKLSLDSRITRCNGCCVYALQVPGVICHHISLNGPVYARYIHAQLTSNPIQIKQLHNVKASQLRIFSRKTHLTFLVFSYERPNMMISWHGHARISGRLWWKTPITGRFPSQRTSDRKIDVFLSTSLNKLLNKHSIIRCLRCHDVHVTSF